MLPLFSLPGEIGSLSSTNVLHAQLDSGQMGMSTIADAVNEGGVTDITLDKNDSDGFEQKDDLNGSTLWNILELGETLDPKDRNSKDNSIHHNVDTSSRSSSVLM